MSVYLYVSGNHIGKLEVKEKGVKVDEHGCEHG